LACDCTYCECNVELTCNCYYTQKNCNIFNWDSNGLISSCQNCNCNVK
jgi:hypothetical protein